MNAEPTLGENVAGSERATQSGQRLLEVANLRIAFASGRSLLAAVDETLSLDDPTRTLSYADSQRDIAKRARVEDDILIAVRLAGETKAAEWLTELMVRGQPASPLRPWLLAPLTQPPAGQPSRGKVICNCFDVSEDTILSALRGGETLEQLQARTECGTNCGSCIPELKRLAAQAGRTAS